MSTRYGTVPHVGPRHVETVSDTPRQMFKSTCLWNTKLPDSAKLAADNGEVTELVRQSKINAASLNTHTFTADVLTVPPDQPLVPVTLDAKSAANSPALAKVFQAGLPIPDWWTPTVDNDSQFCAYQPDYVHPTLGRKGRYWDAQSFRKDPNTGGWLASWGGRINGTDQNNGHYSWWTYDGYKSSDPGHPDSTYVEGSWGATATSLPLGPSIVTLEDLQFGKIEHALGLIVYDARAGQFVWPAQRSDGGSSTIPVKEGMRFRFPPGSTAPDTLHPVAKLIFDAVRDYGFVVNDRTLWCLAVRAEPACEQFYGSASYWQILDGFPWQDLKLLAVGSDTTPNPTA